jgi:high affinity Mn2+ porin
VIFPTLLVLAISAGICVGSVAALAQDSSASPPTPESADAPAANASDTAKAEPAEESVSFHGQVTNIWQWHPAFTSPYRGPQSLDPGNRGDETLSLSLFVGWRLWQGAEFYVNPEFLQGFGLSNTNGIAAYTNGEAFKIGSSDPVGQISRAFIRQTFALGDATETVESDQNQLAGQRPVDRITLTVGKYAVVDIFDDNKYAHDSRSGFLNWAINDMGAFDMASPAYNYTYGATAEWYQSWWTVRTGIFAEPTLANSKDIDTSFNEFQPVVELEERHELWGQPGKVKILIFGKYVRAGSFADALALSEATGQPPSTALVRGGRVWGYGGGVNLEQQITSDLGMFARFSQQTGKYEEWAFTQIEQSISAGLVLTGTRWGRDNDSIGAGVVASAIGKQQQAYLAAGGTGIIIGDGALSYGGEEVIETYYKYVPWDWAAITADYQFVEHPAYNRVRGPVSVFGLRFHAEF